MKHVEEQRETVARRQESGSERGRQSGKEGRREW